MERIWRREGLKVPMKQPKRGRFWLNDGSCTRLKPEHEVHVCDCDFVACRTEDGRAVRMLTVIDEYTGECPAIRTARRIRSEFGSRLLERNVGSFLQTKGKVNRGIRDTNAKSPGPGLPVGFKDQVGNRRNPYLSLAFYVHRVDVKRAVTLR